MDKIIHGLDLSDEVLKHNEKLLMEKLNITESDIDTESDEDDD